MKYLSMYLLFTILIMGFATASSFAIDVSAKDFGAKGDGKTDDRAAIQAAIDAVHKSGGGTVLFPQGIYMIKALPYDRTGVAKGYFKGKWQPQIRVYNNTTFKGVGMYKSIIKTTDDSKEWDCIISGDNIEGFSIYDIGFDCNGVNNPVVNNDIEGADGYFHVPVYFFEGSSIMVKRCRFTNQSGIWAVYLYKKAENVAIDSCIFDNIGGWTKQDYDVSTIRIDGKGPILVSNTIMQSRLGPNSTGVRTAVEIHGSNTKFINNTITGFREAINICSGGDGLNQMEMSKNQYYGRNTIRACGTGFIIWHLHKQGLDNLVIENNDFEVDMSWNESFFWPEPEWGDWGFPDFGAIILTGTPGWPYPPITMTNLKILNNKITFVNPKYSTDRSYGISLGYGYAGNAEAPLERVEISGNTIENPFSGGIYIDANMKDVKISNNIIINPAQEKARSDQKCAIKLAGKGKQVIIENNMVRDTRSTHVINSIIYSELSNLEGCSYNERNKAELNDGKSIPVFHAGFRYLGKPWR